MNHRQYEQSVANRKRRTYTSLFSGPEIGRVLRSMARDTTRLDVANQAWHRIVSPDLAALTAVVSFAGGTLSIAVGDAATRHSLTQDRDTLCRRLQPLLPGLRAVRFQGRSTTPRPSGDARQA